MRFSGNLGNYFWLDWEVFSPFFFANIQFFLWQNGFVCSRFHCSFKGHSWLEKNSLTKTLSWDCTSNWDFFFFPSSTASSQLESSDLWTSCASCCLRLCRWVLICCSVSWAPSFLLWLLFFLLGCFNAVDKRLSNSAPRGTFLWGGTFFLVFSARVEFSISMIMTTNQYLLFVSN